MTPHGRGKTVTQHIDKTVGKKRGKLGGEQLDYYMQTVTTPFGPRTHGILKHVHY